MPGISLPDALARGVLLPSLRQPRVLDYWKSPYPLCSVQAPDVSNGWHDLSGYPYPIDGLVSRDLVGHDSKERSQRLGPATNSRTEELRNRMDLAS